MYWDAQLSLYKMGTRYYDPTIGRFMQADPIEGGALNRYDYAAQNPINYIDPKGEIFGISCETCKRTARFISRSVRTVRDYL